MSPGRPPDAPPSLRLLPWAKIRQFDYFCEDERFATIEIVAELRSAWRVPNAPEIHVRRGARVTAHRPLRKAVRRVQVSSRDSGRQARLLLTVSFKLPLRLAQHPDVSFSLATAELSSLALPALTRREITTPAQVVGTWFSEKLTPAGQLVPAGRRISVLASTVAFGAGLSSAVVIASPATARELARLSGTITSSVLSITQTTSTSSGHSGRTRERAVSTDSATRTTSTGTTTTTTSTGTTGHHGAPHHGAPHRRRRTRGGKGDSGTTTTTSTTGSTRTAATSTPTGAGASSVPLKADLDITGTGPTTTGATSTTAGTTTTQTATTPSSTSTTSTQTATTPASTGTTTTPTGTTPVSTSTTTQTATTPSSTGTTTTQTATTPPSTGTTTTQTATTPPSTGTTTTQTATTPASTGTTPTPTGTTPASTGTTSTPETTPTTTGTTPTAAATTPGGATGNPTTTGTSSTPATTSPPPIKIAPGASAPVSAGTSVSRKQTQPAASAPINLLLQAASKGSSLIAGAVAISKKAAASKRAAGRGCEVPAVSGIGNHPQARHETSSSTSSSSDAAPAGACEPIADQHHKNAAKTLSGGAAVNASKSDGGAGVVVPAPAPAPIVTNPTQWGGSPWADTYNAAELEFYASLVKNVNLPPQYLIPIYRAAGRRYHVPWQLLAAINRMETDYGRDLSVSSAGAIGWMQFEPGTWEEYGVAVDRHDKVVRGRGNPYNPRDAIFAAARYLRASGATRNVPRAVFAYNHADWYVTQVLSIAQQINVHGLHRRSGHNHKIGTMVATARLLNGMPYAWGGGHAGWGISNGYDCSGFVSMVLHSAGFLRYPVTTQTLPDQRWIRSGHGRWVTIYDRTDSAITGDHVIIDLKGQWWESGGSTLAGGGARVHQIKMTKALRRSYLPTFNLVLHPSGL